MKSTLIKKRRNKKNVLLKMSKEQIELFEIEYWKRYNIARQSRWSARESHKLEVGGSSPPRAPKQIDSFLFKWLNLIQKHTTAIRGSQERLLIRKLNHVYNDEFE